MTNIVFILAITLLAECAGEPWIGKVAVCDVIYNRSKERRQTLVEVVKAYRQFSCWNSTKEMDKLAAAIARGEHRNDYAWKDCLTLAKELAAGTWKPKSNSNHYYNPLKASPSWGPKMRDQFTIGNHLFGRLP